jgi:hypothetical protein
VKGLDLNTGGTERSQARAQFASRAIGVGESQHSICCVVALGYAVGDSVRDGSSFACASTGQYASWPNQRLSR